VLTLPEQDVEPVAYLRNMVLVQRLEALHQRVVGKARAQQTLGVEGVMFDKGATLLLHGEVNSSTTPNLDAVLDGIISLQPSSLTVDLTETTGVSFDALAAITRRSTEVEHFAVRLPDAPSSTLVNLLGSAGKGVQS
jgi:hypothetical protein